MASSSVRRWDRRWAEAGETGEAAAWVAVAVTTHTPPPPGRAIDIAGGSGRHALLFAGLGYDTTLVDQSPVGIDIAMRTAAVRGVALHAEVRDLEVEAIPNGPWDLALINRFLDRDVLRSALGALATGGVLLFAQPTLTNLERNERPPAEVLLAPGELAALLADWAVPGIEIVSLDEAWRENDAHEARLVARRT